MLIIHPSLALRLSATSEAGSPRLEVLRANEPPGSGALEIEFPEHAWGRRESSTLPERLCTGAIGAEAIPSAPLLPWKGSWEHVDAASISYRWQTMPGLWLHGQATCFSHGLRLRYTWTNDTAVAYEEVQAVTCVKLRHRFADPRLERCLVHHPGGWELLGCELPDRLLLPEREWFPCRYLVPFNWPARTLLKESVDGIVHYHKSRSVDVGVIATPTRDGEEMVATFTRRSGNLWTNPERSCHHADPSTPLPAGSAAHVDLTVFIVRGTPADLLDLIRHEMLETTADQVRSIP